MGGRKLSRWQKASAVVPVALMVGAWGAALTDTNLATASSGDDGFDPGVPKVPTTSFEQPASVQAPNGPPSGIDPKAGPKGTLSTLSSAGIPAAALLAYKHTETLLDRADPACHLPWTLVAAIGRVESNHGRHGGNAVGADGVSRPGIFGLPLDGSGGTARVSDTDNGTFDNDAVWDRAVGPMQFIPSTWDTVGVDGNGDGQKNPQDINDAALATGVYLCAGQGDVGTDAGAREAVLRYNHSGSYADLVLSIAQAYADGDFTRSPNGVRTPAVLTSHDNDQTLPANKHKGNKHRSGHAKGTTTSDQSNGGGAGPASGGAGQGGSGGGSGTDGSGPSTGGQGGTETGGDAGKQLQKSAKDVGDKVTKTGKGAAKDTKKVVKDVISMPRALAECGKQLPTLLDNKANRQACAEGIVGKPVSHLTGLVANVLRNLLGI